MDVWATRAATVSPSEIPVLTPDDPRREGLPQNAGGHGHLQACYRTAAAECGLTPREFQAVVWVGIRSMWVRADGRINGAR